MNVKKNVMRLAVAAALGFGAGPTFAAVTGVPGEALLVPLVMNDGAAQGTGQQNTYVQIRVPTTLGQDFVMNTYTAPNVTGAAAGGVVITPEFNDPAYAIHWTLYDYKSVKIENGTCQVSPGDAVIWTTDPGVSNAFPPGFFPPPQSPVPAPGCGPSNLSTMIGYVVFETAAGADGLEADFVMEGKAWITDRHISSPNFLVNPLPGVKLLTVPVMPLADGADPVNACDDHPRVGINEVLVRGTAGDGNLTDPCENGVAPLAAGIRMNNGDNALDKYVITAGAVQGLANPNQGLSLHAFWFDNNNADRQAEAVLWDEHEQNRSFILPLPREVNVWVYNAELTNNPFPQPLAKSWGNLNANLVNFGYQRQNGRMVDIVSAVYGTRVRQEYPLPNFWLQTFQGYAEYAVLEEGDNVGEVSSAAVMFEAQEAPIGVADAWTSDAMTARGFQ